MKQYIYIYIFRTISLISRSKSSKKLLPSCALSRENRDADYGSGSMNTESGDIRHVSKTVADLIRRRRTHLPVRGGRGRRLSFCSSERSVRTDLWPIAISDRAHARTQTPSPRRRQLRWINGRISLSCNRCPRSAVMPPHDWAASDGQPLFRGRDDPFWPAAVGLTAV